MSISKNIRIKVEYDGTNYYGWQVQKRQKTVQQVLTDAIGEVVQQKIKLIGASRTDAGVHALGMVANFRMRKDIPLDKLKSGANSFLPDDVFIKNIEDVHIDFHSRFDAKGKWYRYTVMTEYSPFWRNYAFFMREKINVSRMKEASGFLIGKKDFTSFGAAGEVKRDPIRKMRRITITKEKNLIFFDIEAESFLQHMVRIIVGTLIEVGRGKLKVSDMDRILKAKDRQSAGPTLSGKGLCLMEVRY